MVTRNPFTLATEGRVEQSVDPRVGRIVTTDRMVISIFPRGF